MNKIELRRTLNIIFTIALIVGCGKTENIKSKVVASKIIYGKDNRQEIIDADNYTQQLAEATAVYISKKHFKYNNGYYQLDNRTYGNIKNLCKEERFKNQIIPGNCTGFLVASDLLVTAGHCLDIKTLKTSKWFFGFKANRDRSIPKILPSKNAYSIKKILARTALGTSDYALIQLNRPVLGVTPLKYRKSGSVDRGTNVFTIGYPYGLAAKMSDGGKVEFSFKRKVFSTKLDTYDGSSGSPVFNETTGEVEGILIGGKSRDFEFDKKRKCYFSKKCKDTGLNFCGSEYVFKITKLKELMKINKNN